MIEQEKLGIPYSVEPVRRGDHHIHIQSRGVSLADVHALMTGLREASEIAWFVVKACNAHHRREALLRETLEFLRGHHNSGLELIAKIQGEVGEER